LPHPTAILCFPEINFLSIDWQFFAPHTLCSPLVHIMPKRWEKNSNIWNFISLHFPSPHFTKSVFNLLLNLLLFTLLEKYSRRWIKLQKNISLENFDGMMSVFLHWDFYKILKVNVREVKAAYEQVKITLEKSSNNFGKLKKCVNHWTFLTLKAFLLWLLS
jgi:hypothetical protein